jgi:DNA-binding sugar fermentation-stimulating protein
MISSQAYVFETPLIEGVVIKSNSQFTMTIEAEGQNAKAHCPTTTRIGDIDIAGRPSFSYIRRRTDRHRLMSAWRTKQCG